MLFVRSLLNIVVVAIAIAIVGPGSPCFSVAAPATPPATAYWDGAHMKRVHASGLANDPRLKEVFKRLRKNADIALGRGPYSVMDKNVVPPSGDKHDYLSYARYWWPNPDAADGLPYVRRDGKTNPEIVDKGDRATIGNMYDDVETLALAGYFLDEPRYSEHAAKLIRVWFLEPATRMNPHLKFGQAIPGRTEGRGSGIIDTRHFIRVCDSIAVLRQGDAWPDGDDAAFKAWATEYLDWLISSPAGEDERSGGNNHGTWYDAQTAALALFVGERDTARRIVDQAKQARIARCLEPDGSQPVELERTKSLHYSVFNLSAMSVLARLGESVDVDLWTYESPDGRSIRRGLDFVMPYLSGQQKWQHQQIEAMSVSPTDLGLFCLAAARYDEPKYLLPVATESRKPAKFEYTPLLFPGK